MQGQTKDFATIFLLEFTKELVENSRKDKIIELRQRHRLPHPNEIQKVESIKKIRPIIKKKFRKIEPASQIQNIKTPEQQPKMVLTIPQPRLPPRFQNINPFPTKIDIDLGKLNPILKNPRTEVVECDGPNIPIKIIEKGKRKVTTKISLTKQEIDNIIQTFSEKKKIPVMEGVYKVAAGNLILLAVVSSVVGSRFVIRKISEQMPQRNPQTRQPIRY